MKYFHNLLKCYQDDKHKSDGGPIQILTSATQSTFQAAAGASVASELWAELPQIISNTNYGMRLFLEKVC